MHLILYSVKQASTMSIELPQFEMKSVHIPLCGSMHQCFPPDGFFPHRLQHCLYLAIICCFHGDVLTYDLGDDLEACIVNTCHHGINSDCPLPTGTLQLVALSLIVYNV